MNKDNRICIYSLILVVNPINHGVVFTDHGVVYKDHAVVCRIDKYSADYSCGTDRVFDTIGPGS